MPYVIEEFKNGFIICDKHNHKLLLKKPLKNEKAIKKRQAVAIHSDNKNIFDLLKSKE